MISNKHPVNLFCEIVPCASNYLHFFLSFFNSRLVTCEADKSIKIWKENPLSTEASDPIDMDAWSKECLQLKRY